MLVVEDDQDLSALLDLVLSDAGYDVRVAGDGRAALRRLEEQMPGVILLDMRMPVMNGWEFAREFRARHGRACPVVVITAAENARLRAEEIGADGWLAKPFDLDAVLDMVERQLRGGPAGAASPPSQA